MCLTDVPDDEGDLSRDLYALQTVQDSEDEDARPEFILRKDLQRISRAEEGASWKLLELHMDGDTPG